MPAARPRPFDIPILMYHHVVPGATVPAGLSYTVPLALFERQLDSLDRRGFETITFHQLFGMMDGTWQPTRERVVLLTFDDGYQSFLDLAVPALQKRRMSATVFVVAREIGGYNRWDADQGRPRLPLMNAAALQRATESGMEVGVHGWSHRALTGCGPAELEQEVVGAKQEIDTALGIVTEAFCYPYGEYSDAAFPVLARAGFRGAVSIFSDADRVTSQPYAMRRVFVHENDGAMRFALKLSQFYLRRRPKSDRKIRAGARR